MPEWTKRQQSAISARKGEYVVSASAGTGKTSVIIERAWQLVSMGYANIDELLIVTFTEKAAAELLSRLQERLESELALGANPDKISFLLNQLNRLDRAQISTIHSLCLRIVRENYQILGLTHNVQCIPPEQLILLHQRVIDEIFERMYADDSARGQLFREFVRIYGCSRVDANLKQLILQMNSFLVTIANPENWIENVNEFIKRVQQGQFDPSEILARVFVSNWLLIIDNYQRQLDSFEQILSSLGITKILHHINELKDILENVKRNLLVNDFHKIDIQLPSTPKVPKGTEWDEYRKNFSDMKASLRKFLSAIQSNCDVVIDDIVRQLPFIEMILFLLQEFQIAVKREKRKSGLIDYDDILQLAFKLLSEEREILERYRRLFKFIMVDEYQDINELQDAILRKLANIRNPIDKEKGSDNSEQADWADNLLVVGDVKQSIYRFRLAEPAIFQSFCKRARKSTWPKHIALKENFRSNRIVIDTVNTLFSLMMAGGAMEIEYDESHNLVYAADFPEQGYSEQLAKTELHIIERKIELSDNNSDNKIQAEHENNTQTKYDEQENDFNNNILEYESQEREAFFVAERIEKLISDGYKIYDKRVKSYRPIKPDDIVILLRSLKGTANKFASMLQRKGIPVSVSQIEAFLDYTEIADIVSLLRIIVNPFDDIALASVLRSPIVRATISELAEIRQHDNGYLFSALQRYSAEHEEYEQASKRKFADFLERLQQWRDLSSEIAPDELIQRIYIDTKYVDYAHLVPQASEIAQNNLNQFLALARDFSSTGQVDIADFIEYLDLIAESELTFSNINTPITEGVKIMSIHASKGLEFPVVILAGLGKQFNLQDVKPKILFDKDMLIGMQLCDEDESVSFGCKWRETFTYSAIKQSKIQQLKAEELRLLYVAMTRARDKLILTGNANLEQLFKLIEDFEGKSSLASVLISQKSFISWIVCAIAASEPDIFSDINFGDFVMSEEVLKYIGSLIDVYLYPQAVQEGWNITKSNVLALRAKSSEATLEQIIAKRNIKSQSSDKVLSAESKALLEKLQWQYPHRVLTHIPATISVTEFAHRHQADDSADPMDSPQFELVDTDIDLLSEQESLAIERGLAWHGFMEKINLKLDMTEENIRKELDRLMRENLITDKQSRLIDIVKVQNFFSTIPGKLMLEFADRVKREQPFTYLIPANSLPDLLRLGETDEAVLVHGIIDCLILNEGKLTIIDYKTSQITASDVDAKVKLYKPQVELYATAMSDILRCPVESVWLYFTEPNSAIRVL